MKAREYHFRILHLKQTESLGTPQNTGWEREGESEGGRETRQTENGIETGYVDVMVNIESCYQKEQVSDYCQS